MKIKKYRKKKIRKQIKKILISSKPNQNNMFKMI